MPRSQASRKNTIGMTLSISVGVIWLVYALTDGAGWLRVVAIVLSIVAGLWWAFGDRVLNDGGAPAGGRQRDRSR